MVTSAFLLKVVVYGLITSLLIPVIDFLMFFFRESRKPNRLDENRSTLNEWHPTGVSELGLVSDRPQTGIQAGVEGNVVRTEAARENQVERISGRYVRENGTISYMASNGVTITPSVRPEPRPGHPHADYWQYGNMAFYERG